MGKIDYSRLKGKIDRFKPAPSGNPHLWMLVDAGTESFFTTINVRSSKGLPGDPIAKSYLNFFVDTDFRHPIVSQLRAATPGVSRVAQSYEAGAIDFIKGNLFDPRRMRVLPNESAGGDDLVHRLEGILQTAREQNDDIVIYGSQFQTSQGQTDAVFGETPAVGVDNVHMAQGDPPKIDNALHENGHHHDGVMFLLSTTSDRVTAIFLAFQSQGWQTDANGQPVAGSTGYEAPTYVETGATLGNLVPPKPVLAELTSLNRLPGGNGSLVVTNMSPGDLDVSGWSVTSPTVSLPLPNTSIEAGQPLSLNLPANLIADGGGILSLLDRNKLKVDGVAYLGGSAAGWSTSFS